MKHIIALVMILAATAAYATEPPTPKTVEVTDLGADPTGKTASTAAFQQAAWRAGPGGRVTCQAGRYRIADVRIFFEHQIWDCPAVILPAWNAESLFIIDRFRNFPKPVGLQLNFHVLEGEWKDVTCLDVRNSFGSVYRFTKIWRCGRGLAIGPVEKGHGVWNNNFHGVTITGNKEAINITAGAGCVEGTTIRLNFVAWNDMGLNMPDTKNCGGTFTVFEGGFDYNERDAIITPDRGYYLFSFVTPDAPPTGSGLAGSFYHIMGPPRMRQWHEPEY